LFVLLASEGEVAQDQGDATFDFFWGHGFQFYPAEAEKFEIKMKSYFFIMIFHIHFLAGLVPA
jgi:hypothetical protein